MSLITDLFALSNKLDALEQNHAPLLRLLDAERIGVSLSDEWQLHPEQSTSAIVVLNPQAKYFSV